MYRNADSEWQDMINALIDRSSMNTTRIQKTYLLLDRDSISEVYGQLTDVDESMLVCELGV